MTPRIFIFSYSISENVFAIKLFPSCLFIHANRKIKLHIEIFFHYQIYVNKFTLCAEIIQQLFMRRHGTQPAVYIAVSCKFGKKKTAAHEKSRCGSLFYHSTLFAEL